MSKVTLAALLLFNLALVSSLGERLDEKVHDPVHEHNEDFVYDFGGDDWHDHQACVKGKRQSPIDLPFFEEDIMDPIPKDYFTRSSTLSRRFLQFVDPIEEEEE